MARTPDSPEAVEAAREPMIYFPHDANAAEDDKCVRLVMRAGAAGYGRWWRLCELMARANGHTVPCETEEDMAILANRLWTDADGAKGFLELLADVGLIDAGCLSEGRVESERMMENALYAGKRKARANKAAAARWGKRNAKGDAGADA